MKCIRFFKKSFENLKKKFFPTNSYFSILNKMQEKFYKTILVQEIEVMPQNILGQKRGLPFSLKKFFQPVWRPGNENSENRKKLKSNK